LFPGLLRQAWKLFIVLTDVEQVLYLNFEGRIEFVTIFRCKLSDYIFYESFFDKFLVKKRQLLQMVFVVFYNTIGLGNVIL